LQKENKSVTFFLSQNKSDPFSRSQNIMAPEVLHEPRNTRSLARRHQQVHVIGHQHVGVQRHAKSTLTFPKAVQTLTVLVFAEKARIPVVSTLYHMHGDIRQIHPCLSRRSNSFAVQLEAS
jgi:hypothetical protein